MGFVKGYLQRKAIDRVPTPVLDAVGKAVLRGVDRAVDQRWDRALDRAADAAGATIDERVDSLSKAFSRELVSLGAATGATAAVPGLGTASALSLLTAEVGWFAFRSTDLIMTVGAAYGHVESSADERRAWVLAILAFGDEAPEEIAKLVQGLETRDALRTINTTLAATVATKYGSRQGLAALGRLLPFGIGAVVGGSTNWALSRALLSQSRRFFENYDHLMLPSSRGGSA